jgi:hypothetical protein
MHAEVPGKIRELLQHRLLLQLLLSQRRLHGTEKDADIKIALFGVRFFLVIYSFSWYNMMIKNAVLK